MKKVLTWFQRKPEERVIFLTDCVCDNYPNPMLRTNSTNNFHDAAYSSYGFRRLYRQ